MKQKKRKPVRRNALLLASLIVAVAASVVLTSQIRAGDSGGTTNGNPGPGVEFGYDHRDVVPGGPGPGHGAVVTYQEDDGMITSLVIYEVGKSAQPVPDLGERVLDVTNDPRLGEMFAWWQQSPGGPQIWYVDLATLQLRTR